MLPGGAGDIGLERDSTLKHGHNSVVRTRGLLNIKGYTVLIPDTIDRANLRGERSSLTYAHLVEHLIAFAHREGVAPVFLLGISQGSIADENGAAHALPSSIAGLVPFPLWEVAAI